MFQNKFALYGTMKYHLTLPYPTLPYLTFTDVTAHYDESLPFYLLQQQ